MQNGNKIYIAYKKNNEHFINYCFYLFQVSDNVYTFIFTPPMFKKAN